MLWNDKMKILLIVEVHHRTGIAKRFPSQDNRISKEELYHHQYFGECL